MAGRHVLGVHDVRLELGPTRTESTAAGALLLGTDSTGDMPTATGRREIQFRVTPDAFFGKTILAPNMIKSVDRTSDALVLGDDGWFTTVESNESLNTYNVTALIPVFEDKQGGITEPELRAAGTDYPASLKAIYTHLPDGSMGEASDALLTAICASVVVPSYADPDNPYDLARTMEAWLRDPAHFKYQEDVRTERNAQCSGISTVECFARIRVGYCDYYATTMAVLLRASGVPARVAYGFLPGDRGEDGVEVVGAWLAHYWVEVYFPGVGWIEFDPTGGGRGPASGNPQRVTATAHGEADRPRRNDREEHLPDADVGARWAWHDDAQLGHRAVHRDRDHPHDRHRGPRLRRVPADAQQAHASRPGVGLAGAARGSLRPRAQVIPDRLRVRRRAGRCRARGARRADDRSRGRRSRLPTASATSEPTG